MSPLPQAATTAAAHVQATNTVAFVLSAATAATDTAAAAADDNDADADALQWGNRINCHTQQLSIGVVTGWGNTESRMTPTAPDN